MPTETIDEKKKLEKEETLKNLIKEQQEEAKERRELLNQQQREEMISARNEKDLADLKKDASFQAPKDANPTSKEFGNRNGTFMSMEEIFDAFLRNDHRVMKLLSDKGKFREFKSFINAKYPNLKDITADGRITPTEMREVLEQHRGIKNP